MLQDVAYFKRLPIYFYKKAQEVVCELHVPCSEFRKRQMTCAKMGRVAGVSILVVSLKTEVANETYF